MADAAGSARKHPTPRVRTPYATNAELSGGQASSRSRRSGDAREASRGGVRSSASKPRARRVAAAGGHRPPVYNIYGNQLPPGKGSGLGQQAPEVFHTREGRPHVPTNWTGTPKHTRPQEVREARRREFLADPSFDLDGDGVVNQRDYFLAKQFDKDGDGKLNAKEWKAAQDALKAGYADRFHSVQGGPAKIMAHRVLQKRGHVLMEEKDGWHVLHNTFSKQDLQPASHKAPFPHESEGGAADTSPRHQGRTLNAATQKQLFKERRKQNLAELRELAGEPQAPPDVDSPLAERAKTSTATRRSHLLRKRRMDATLEALNKQNLPVADYTGRPFQDFITQRLRTTQRSKATSRAQLMKTRTAQFKLEAARMAPTKPPGVHTVVLPSYSEAARAALERGEDPPTWWTDKSHLEGVPPQPWEEPPTARFTASRREKGGLRSGQLLSCTGMLPKGSLPDDPFKKRTITPQEIAARRQRRRELSKKPIEIRPAPVPGTMVRSATADGGVRQKRWTDFVIEFQSDDKVKLTGSDGKTLVVDPAELEPMYSSFTRTGFFDGRVGTAPTGATMTRRSRSRQSGDTYGRPAMTATEELAASRRSVTMLPSGRSMSRGGFGPSASQPALRGGGGNRWGREPLSTSAGGAAGYTFPRSGGDTDDLVTGAPQVKSPKHGGYRNSRPTSPVSGSPVHDGGIQHPRYVGGSRGSRRVRPESAIVPPSPAPNLAGTGRSPTPAGVRAGGFQRLISRGTMRHSVSTPLLLATSRPESAGSAVLGLVQ